LGSCPQISEVKMQLMDRVAERLPYFISIRQV